MTSRLRVLRVQIHHAKSPETQIDSALFGARNHGDYSLHSFVNGHGSERASGQWFLDMARSEGDFFNAGPASTQGKTLLQKAEYGIRYELSKRAMLNRAARLQPHIISSTQNKDLLFSKSLSDKLGSAWVVHVIYPVDRLGKRVLTLLPKADGAIACSHFIERNLRDHGVERVTTIYPAVRGLQCPPDSEECRARIRAELNIPPDAIVIGMAARLVIWKGQRDVLSAFQRLAREHPRLFLVLGGQGEDENELRRRIKAGPAADRVRMIGFRNDMPSIFASWDIATHPSRKEAFGLATAEASLAGLPVVVYDDGAAPEIVENGSTGLVVPLLDDGTPEGANVDGLVSAFATLIERPDLRLRMGQAGRSYIRTKFPSESLTAAKQFTDVVRRLALAARR